MVLGGPADHQMAPEMQALVRANCAETGATLTLTDDPAEAVVDADFVYTVLWWWLEEGEAREALRRTYAPYQVNETLFAKTKPGARFMDCLPAVRGEEATDAIMDGPMSLCFDQSENRKHLQKAVVLALIGIDDLPDDPDLAAIGRAAPLVSAATRAGATPRADGLRLPARSVVHARTLLSWPCRAEVFGPLMEQAKEEWAEVARAIARFEPVTVLARPDDADEARARCGDAGGPRRADGRLVDPRQRADLPRRRGGPRRHDPLRLRRVGPRVRAVRPRRGRAAATSPRRGACAATRRRSCSRAAPSTPTARARS